MRWLTLTTPQIRLFGDPQVYNENDTPTLTVSLTAHVESPRQTVERLPSFDVVPGFVNGRAFGDTIGVFLRNHSPDRLVVNSVTINEEQVNRFLCR